MGESAIAADILVVADDSESTGLFHDWMQDAFKALEAKLNDALIGPNVYSLVSFGSNSPGPGFPPVVRLSSGNIDDLISAIGNLTSIPVGSLEDGYEAIITAIDDFSFRDDTHRLVVLVTSEDRDLRTGSIATKAKAFDKLVNNNCVLNVVVDVKFTSDAIGVDTNGVGFFDDGSGGVEERTGQTAVSGLGSTIEDYVQFAWDLGGSAYDINPIKLGESSGIALLTEAFAGQKTKEMLSDTPTEQLCKFTLDPEEQTFLCDSDQEDDGIISVLENIVGSDDKPLFGRETESDGGGGVASSAFTDFIGTLGTNEKLCMHVRISFYTDPQRTSLLYSAFSLNDQRRWFLKQSDKSPCQLNAKGAIVSASSIPAVFYTPEILPAILMEEQSKHTIGDSVTETPLLCGVRYYLTIEAYMSNSIFYKIQDTSFKFSCRKVRQAFWRDNFDAKNWISSGQGRADFRLSRSSNEALAPSVAANAYGNFCVAWQDFRENKEGDVSQTPDVFYGIWETDRNLFWFSGQGRSDVKALSDVFKPVVVADPARNFVFSGAGQDTISINRCPQPLETAEPEVICAFSDDRLFDIDNTNRDADQYLKARVYGPDAKSSFAISEDNVVSVVGDCFVRFDIVGSPGTYAVRVRAEDDADWSSWINIDQELPTSLSEGDVFTAYFIDNDRFVLPWVIPAGNGIKRVCFQILTHFGITKVFCLDVMAEISEMDYTIELSYAGNSLEKVNQFNGLPVIRHLASEGNTTTNVNVKVTFKDKDRLAKFSAIANADKFSHLNDGGFTFNFIQQGINDQYGLVLMAEEKGVYTGSFVIQSSDGVYNKDGLCAIVVNIPNPCTKLKNIVCAGGDTDVLNVNQANFLKDFYTDYSTLENIEPGAITDTIQSSKLKQITNAESFKQFYSKDDPRFSFANPKFFIKA